MMMRKPTIKEKFRGGVEEFSRLFKHYYDCFVYLLDCSLL